MFNMATGTDYKSFKGKKSQVEVKKYAGTPLSKPVIIDDDVKNITYIDKITNKQSMSMKYSAELNDLNIFFTYICHSHQVNETMYNNWTFTESS